MSTPSPLHPGVSPESRHWAERAYAHARSLSVDIGPRPSAGEGEWRAAQYAERVMRDAGLDTPHIQDFPASCSSYRPYAWAVAAGLLAAIVGWRGGRMRSLFAAVLSLLGASAFYREATLRDNWARRLSPHGASQNVVAVSQPTAEVRHHVVLVGHLDTHRTPIFYSSARWLRVLSLSLVGALASLVGGAALYGHFARTGCRRPGWLAIPAALFQAWALGMLLYADRTPHSPGANDNASGAATVLALGERLAREPLRHTQVWVLNTGCEEVGAQGMAAFLDRYGREMWDADYIDFDMVGVGEPTLNLTEGLLRRVRYTPGLLRAARLADEGLLGPDHTGGAYTDMWPVITRGYRGIVLDARPADSAADLAANVHWHQLSDTFDKLDCETLARTHEWAWRLLQRLDAETVPPDLREGTSTPVG
ncbi:MAG: M20/M25/M40 family metallo-hydrolase [Anaerolineae bacterium]